jgi:hypothetical protein
LLSSNTVSGADSLITNGEFLNWADGLPAGWKVEIGAMNGGDSPTSEVKPIKGPALMLRGDASTLAWHSVSQEFQGQPGETYALEFESRVKDIKREGRQYNNCYVGIMSVDAAGKPIASEIDDLSGDTDWKRHRITTTVPANAVSTKVVIFLSKTGILGVRNVSVTKAQTPDAASGRPKGLLVNSDFSEWVNGLPSDWTVEIGAKNGADAPQSELRQVDGGFSLRGTASTMAWYSVSQDPSLDAGTYRLSFQARSEDVRRQGRQYDNCYVGVMIFDANGQRLGTSVKDLSRNSDWRRHRIEFKVPPRADKTEVIIFLSKTGTLTVKDLVLSKL